MSNKPLFKIPDTVTPANLEQALQQAINLEIATIPTYLYTYYSIRRSWSQEYISKDKDAYKADKKIVESAGNPMSLSTAKGLEEYIKKNAKDKVSAEQAEQMSIDIQVYANEAAALTMSVVIEEMLHMSLSSNVKQGIFGPPQLYASMPEFPAYLPGHEPYFPINAAKFSQDQLKTFLKIESPEAFTGAKEKGNAIDYTTIGAFYRMMEKCVMEHFPGPYQNNRPQLLPGKGYYGPNSINTVYYDREHNPHFSGADDSGDLRHVFDCNSAVGAMNIVVEQGEGHDGGDKLTQDGEPICPNINWDNPDAINKDDYDDKAKEELSHFDKFLKLYCQGQFFINKFGNLGLDFESFFVRNLPDNPRNKKTKDHVDYSADPEIVAISNLINAIYSYIFLMAESCYHNDGHTQFEVFMMGIHKSMIWALSGLCNMVTGFEIEFKDGKRTTTYNVGPTFEPYDFSKSKKSPKEQMADLVKAAPSGSNNPRDVSWIMDYVKVFPDVSMDFTVKKNPLLTSV